MVKEASKWKELERRSQSTAKLAQRKAANGTRRVWGTMKTASHSNVRVTIVKLPKAS